MEALVRPLSGAMLLIVVIGLGDGRERIPTSGDYSDTAPASDSRSACQATAST